LKNDFLPKIKKFTEEIDRYRAEFRDLKGVIRKFDESISVKANKSEFKLQKEHFHRTYIKKESWDDLV